MHSCIRSWLKRADEAKYHIAQSFEVPQFAMRASFQNVESQLLFPTLRLGLLDVSLLRPSPSPSPSPQCSSVFLSVDD